jgi:hypothetical protein
MRTCDIESLKAEFARSLTRMYPELIPEDGQVRAKISYIEDDSPGAVVLVAVCQNGKLVSVEWEN